MQQKLLPFGEDLDEGSGLNPSRSSQVQQATPASKEPEAVGSPLLDEVIREATLEAAWQQVKANKGAPGVDGMTIENFPAWFHEHGSQVMTALMEGTYEPAPVRRVDIPKPGGGTRTLGVPTVLDRVIQQAIAIVLTPIFDPTFSESNHGFRPGRSAHDAVQQARNYVAEGYRWVVDIDLSKFFDRVNHDVLMERLSRRIKDKALLRLIRRYLSAGMMYDGVVVERYEGTPQGGPLSPLLSNVLLDEWDKELECRGHRFARYADDCNIYVRSRKAGERVMTWCRRFLEDRLRLKVNEDKSAVARPWARKFLGYSVTNGKKPKLRLAPQTVTRMKDRVRELTRRSRGISLQQMVTELNRYLRGWLNYYRLIDTPSILEPIDSWIQRRLRCFLLKQWRPGSGRRRALQRLGVNGSWMISTSRKGHWRLSRAHQVHLGLSNQYLADQGLLNLLKQWQHLAKTV